MSIEHSNESPTELLLAHAGLVRGMARALVSGDADVDDVVQETWLAALGSHESQPKRPRAWLASIVRRRAARHHRTRFRLDARHCKGARPEAQPSTSDLASRHEEIQALSRALATLPAHYRDVLVLRYYEGLPPRKVATRLGLPVETTRTRVRRGLAQLRSKLDEDHGGDRRAWAAPLAALCLPETVGAIAASAPLVLGLLAAGLLAAAVLLVVPALVGGRGSGASDGGSEGGRPAGAPTLVGRGAGGAAEHRGMLSAEVGAPTDFLGAPVPHGWIRVRGVLVAKDGGSFTPAQIHVGYLTDQMREVRGPTADVGAQGRFTLLIPYAPWPVEEDVDPTPAMSFSLFAIANGYRPTVKRLLARSGEERDLTLTLERGHALAGRVLDRGGRPVPALGLVALRRRPGARRVVSAATFTADESDALTQQLDRGQATTDDDGRFEIPGLARGPYWVYSSSPDWYVLLDDWIGVNGPSQEILAVPAFALVGDVREEGTSKCVAARLSMHVRSEAGGDMTTSLGTGHVLQAAWLQRETDFTGHLDVTVLAYAQGYRPYETSLHYAPKVRRKRLDIRLRRVGSGSLVIRVLKADGSECKDEVQIDLARPGMSLLSDRTAPKPRDRISPIRTEAPAIRWVVSALPMGAGLPELLAASQEVEVQADREELVELHLPPYGTVDVQVVGLPSRDVRSFELDLGRGAQNPHVGFSGSRRVAWPVGTFTIHYETGTGRVTRTFYVASDETTTLILPR